MSEVHCLVDTTVGALDLMKRVKNRVQLSVMSYPTGNNGLVGMLVRSAPHIKREVDLGVGSA